MTVVLLLTMHNRPEVFSETQSSKLYMVLDYNATKRAFDALDKDTSYYTCAHKTSSMANEAILFRNRGFIFHCICSVEHEESDLERSQGFQAL